MKKISRIILPVLLLLLTVLTVAAPRIISAVTDRRLFAEKEEWDFSRGGSPEISGAQAAELYRTGQLDLYFSPDGEGIKNDSVLPDTAPQSVYSMLARVFGRESSIYAYLEKNISEEICFVSQKNTIALVDGHPVAFNAVGISINMRDGSVITLSYEERTLALIKFEYSIHFSEEGNDLPFSSDSFGTELSRYCDDCLSLSPDDYFLESGVYGETGYEYAYAYYGILRFQNGSEYDSVIKD